MFIFMLIICVGLLRISKQQSLPHNLGKIYQIYTCSIGVSLGKCLNITEKVPAYNFIITSYNTMQDELSKHSVYCPIVGGPRSDSCDSSYVRHRVAAEGPVLQPQHPRVRGLPHREDHRQHHPMRHHHAARLLLGRVQAART